jgi:uncharacterized GH25 family protein
MKTRLSAWLMAIGSLIGTSAAQAHHIWLEQASKSGTAQLYFGEFGSNLREASPGFLDKFVKPSAQKITASGAEPVTLTKGPLSFALSTRVAAGESLVVEETNYPITARKQGEQSVSSWYHPAARLITDWRAQEPRLKLDIVPTGRNDKNGNELRVVYNGQPLGKVKVSITTPSGWGQEHRTAEDGTLRVQLPWRGTYVIEVSQSDSTPGEREGQKFDRISYVTSLTVVQAKGLPALDAASPLPPNKMN